MIQQLAAVAVARDGAAIDPETAWAAVVSRDPAADGSFFYAVRSTGVFCRPVCPSRQPRRDNVSFFPTAAAASAAGFRPCRRCRPDGGRPAAVRAVERAREYLDQHLDQPVTLERLGRETHMSPWHLQRTFKRVLGVTPRQYAQARRAEQLKLRLRAGETVSRATYAAGYGSSSRVYEQAAARLGMTPAAYRRGGRGVRIRFAVVGSPLGDLLVAATDRGVCSVALGDDAGELEASLRREYPQARLERDPAGLEAWTTAIVMRLGGARDPIELPLDVRATAFQQRVWRALREIPSGETRSYGELAAELGAPGAARAVGRACASNPVALLIPCHRVVRGDGEPGGYRWGVERKQRLLAQEREGRGA